MRVIFPILLWALSFSPVFAQEVELQRIAVLNEAAQSMHLYDEMARPQSEQASAERVMISGSKIGEHLGRDWANIEIILSIFLLIITGLIIFWVMRLAENDPKAWSPQTLLRFVGVVLIVPLAVVLVFAGYSTEQMSPVIGLMGVIVGYLLGNNGTSEHGGE